MIYRYLDCGDLHNGFFIEAFLKYTHGLFTEMYMIAGGNDDVLLHFIIW